MNLLNETINFISDNSLRIEDIVYIGNPLTGHQCSWEEFCILADKDYDSGFGSVEVALDLEIIFKDGSRMYRHEYDGYECWRCLSKIDISIPKKPITNLFMKEYSDYTLQDIN